MTEKKKIEDFNDAMLAFQKLAVSATKEGKNPHFKSTYSTLEEVMAAARQANQFGLFFMQPLDLITLGEQIVQVVRTEIVHAPSGETRTSICPIRSKDNQDPQKWVVALPTPSVTLCRQHLVCHQKTTMVRLVLAVSAILAIAS